MNKSGVLSVVVKGMVLWSALFAVSPTCWAVFVYFDGSTSSDFLDATNWSPEGVPGANLVDIYGIDDGLSSTMTGGLATLKGLRVGSAAKEHQFGETHYGQLTIVDAALEVIGVNTLAIGREREYKSVGGDYNRNTYVDAADYTVWRDKLGQNVSPAGLSADGDANGMIQTADYDYWKVRFGRRTIGGEVFLTGTSTLKANGALIGERTKGALSIGPTSAVEIRIWDTTVTPNQFGGSEDLRIGNYGPAYDDFGAEPGLAGDGVVNVQGSLLAKDLYLSENGGKGEIVMAGGTVNFNGTLRMDFCGNCVPDPALMAQRLSKITVLGSAGTFNVGIDPDPEVIDPLPPPRDLTAASTTAVFSFTADVGGVTPIVVAENSGEASGTAFIMGAQLMLNLDAYTAAAPLTLINAAPGHLSGTFGSVTFLGSRTATVNYDVANGDVFLSDFQLGAGTGALAATAVPEPAGLITAAIAGLASLIAVRKRSGRGGGGGDFSA